MNKFKKPIPIVLQAIYIYVGSMALSLIFSGLMGKLYRYIEGPYLGRSIGVLSDMRMDTFIGGFLYAYLLFLGLFVGLYIKNKFLLTWLIGFLLVGWISFGGWKYFLFAIAVSFVAFFLGKLISLVYKKIKK